MKYMGSYYHTLSVDHLKRLKSQKYVRLQKIENEPKFYFNVQEAARLKAQIGWIDAVLAARASQPILL